MPLTKVIRRLQKDSLHTQKNHCNPLGCNYLMAVDFSTTTVNNHQLPMVFYHNLQPPPVPPVTISRESSVRGFIFSSFIVCSFQLFFLLSTFLNRIFGKLPASGDISPPDGCWSHQLMRWLFCDFSYIQIYVFVEKNPLVFPPPNLMEGLML